ncbi:MAG TPA: DNA repair protein RecO [Candidatus Cybelea sp.]|nr:DNA repair protein RecO [Candidatus Cybelea sp.]
MHWTDDAIVLASRKHGETSAVVNLLTRDHGRHAGLVRGGASRRLKGVLQAGNEVSASWRGRLAEHLGTLTIELRAAHAASLMEDSMRLSALVSACALVEATLPEREPHPGLFQGLAVLLQSLHEGAAEWPAVYVRWEVGLLSELGFGLDLSACAVTGETSGLTHVSPKTGRAVSSGAAAPYAEKLFRLPPFLAGGEVGDPLADIADGLALTGFFLDRYAFAPHRRSIPAARARLVERFTRRTTTSGVREGA